MSEPEKAPTWKFCLASLYEGRLVLGVDPNYDLFPTLEAAVEAARKRSALNMGRRIGVWDRDAKTVVGWFETPRRPRTGSTGVREVPKPAGGAATSWTPMDGDLANAGQVREIVREAIAEERAKLVALFQEAVADGWRPGPGEESKTFDAGRALLAFSRLLDRPMEPR